MRGSSERGYFVPACVGSGRWADFESCSRIHACGFRCVCRKVWFRARGAHISWKSMVSCKRNTHFLKKCGFVQEGHTFPENALCQAGNYRLLSLLLAVSCKDEGTHSPVSENRQSHLLTFSENRQGHCNSSLIMIINILRHTMHSQVQIRLPAVWHKGHELGRLNNRWGAR